MHIRGHEIARTSGSESTLQVAVLSDCPTNRAGLHALLDRYGIDVTVEAPLAVLEQGAWKVPRCDAVLLDIGTASLTTSLALCEYLVSNAHGIAIVGVHCSGPFPTQVASLVREGMTSYISIAKEVTPLQRALDGVMRGCSVIEVPAETLPATLRTPPQLSDIDLRIVQLAVQGMTDVEVGKELSLHRDSVKHRIRELYKRYDIADRCQLGAWAVHWGLVHFLDRGNHVEHLNPPGARRH